MGRNAVGATPRGRPAKPAYGRRLRVQPHTLGAVLRPRVAPLMAPLHVDTAAPKTPLQQFTSKYFMPPKGPSLESMVIWLQLFHVEPSLEYCGVNLDGYRLAMVLPESESARTMYDGDTAEENV